MKVNPAFFWTMKVHQRGEYEDNCFQDGACNQLAMPAGSTQWRFHSAQRYVCMEKDFFPICRASSCAWQLYHCMPCMKLCHCIIESMLHMMDSFPPHHIAASLALFTSPLVRCVGWGLASFRFSFLLKRHVPELDYRDPSWIIIIHLPTWPPSQNL